MGLSGSPVASSIEPPTMPASAANRMIAAASSGSSAYPFSRSAFTGRSVAAAISRQLAISSSRVIESVPSIRPQELENPRLVVANASKASEASNFAVPASQGLGMMKIPGRSCSARNDRARSACVRMVNSYRQHLVALAVPLTKQCSPTSERLGVTKQHLWLDHLFLAVLAAKAEHAGFVACLENGIRVLSTTWTGNTK